MLRTSSSSAARSVRATPRARWPTATRAWAAPRPPLSSASSSSSAWLPEYTWRTSRPSPRSAGATAARQDGGAGRRLRGAAGHKGRRPRVQAPPPTPPSGLARIAALAEVLLLPEAQAVVRAASDHGLLDAFLLLADVHPGGGKAAQPGDGKAAQ
ncbi:hypothetical protein BS78_09G052500 [Paspalum vaginatum]|nr:hypothetical protein BS78_09G052500 [Paspalum vaginatum]